MDPVSLSQQLIRCPSVTPEDAGAMSIVQQALEKLGFTCTRLRFEEPGTDPIENLYARYGTKGKNLAFAGHTDVVPVGERSAWSVNPFAAEIKDDILIGRGAVDMKCSVAAWIAAVSNFLETNDLKETGSLSMIITGDEESVAINGTQKIITWLNERQETVDACIVGEPTNPSKLGEMAKIGRRGSVCFTLVIQGIQGHVAYPDSAENPVTALVNILHELKSKTLDEGTEFFPPSNLEVTTVDVGNDATNVIPATASAKFNIRFNTNHTKESLIKWVEEVTAKIAPNYTLKTHGTADAFMTEPGELSDIVVDAVEKVLGNKPALTTTGGTSDARFIKDICPVVEFGLINETAHKIDEQIAVKDIQKLTEIYQKIIARYFAA